MSVAQVSSAGLARQPDIGYAPDLDKYLARVARRKATEELTSQLPEGFPHELKSDLVWDGSSIGNKYNFVYELNAEDLQEIEDALQHFKCRFLRCVDMKCANITTALGKSLGFIDQDTFPLPKLRATLRNISDEVHNGHGFKVLRGLPFDKHDNVDNIVIYAGVSSHIAPIRGRQDYQYQGQPADVVLSHIKDLSSILDANKIGAPAYTTEKQVFHTDVGDVIALACLETAAEGGESKLSSSWTVYNELARTRPDLIKTLAEPWASEKYVCATSSKKVLLTAAIASAVRAKNTRFDRSFTISPKLSLLLRD